MEDARLGPRAIPDPSVTASLKEKMLAAVLACGPGAVASHRSAAWLWRIVPCLGGPIEVTKKRVGRAPAGVWAYRSDLLSDEVAQVDGIPATSVSRTLLDLAVVVTRRRLQLAIEEAKGLGLTDSLSLARLLERHPRRRGAGELRRALDLSAVPSRRAA